MFILVVFSLVFIIFRVFFGSGPSMNVLNDVAVASTKSKNKYSIIVQNSHPDLIDQHDTYHHHCHHLKSWE